MLKKICLVSVLSLLVSPLSAKYVIKFDCSVDLRATFPEVRPNSGQFCKSVSGYYESSQYSDGGNDVKQVDISQSTFEGCENIQQVENIFANSRIMNDNTIEKNILKDCFKVTYITFKSSSVEKVEEGAFDPLISLLIIDLSDNVLTYFSMEWLRNSPNLITLNLKNNKILDFDVRPHPSLSKLFVYNNFLSCTQALLVKSTLPATRCVVDVDESLEEATMVNGIICLPQAVWTKRVRNSDMNFLGYFVEAKILKKSEIPDQNSIEVISQETSVEKQLKKLDEKLAEIHELQKSIKEGINCVATTNEHNSLFLQPLNTEETVSPTELPTNQYEDSNFQENDE